MQIGVPNPVGDGGKIMPLSLEILICDFCRRTVRVSEQRYPAVFTTECPFDICPVNAEFRPTATSRLKEQNIAKFSIAFAENEVQ